MVLPPIWLPLAGTVLVARCGALDGVSLLQVPGSRGAPGDPQPKARRRHGGDGGEAELESSAADPVVAVPLAAGGRPERGARSPPTMSYLDVEFGGEGQDSDCFVYTFMGDHFVGNPQRLNVSSYTTAEAEQAGLHDKTLSSFIVYGPYCSVTFYGLDEFIGWEGTFGPGHWDLSRSLPQGFVDNDVSSIRIVRVSSTTSTSFHNPIGPRTGCRTLLYYGQVWGQSGKGLRVDAQTGGTLAWIGCNGNGCPPDSFYCNDVAGVGMEFGTTDEGPLRALLGNTWPTTDKHCSSAAHPWSISDAPDRPIDVQRLCEQLGYLGGHLLERSGLSSCPEVHWNRTAWTAEFTTSHGHGKRFQCTVGRTTMTTTSATSTRTVTSSTPTFPVISVTGSTITSTSTTTSITTLTVFTTRTTRTHTTRTTPTMTTTCVSYTTHSHTTSTKTTFTTLTATTATTLTNTTTPTTTTWSTTVTSTTGTTTTTTGPATCSKLEVTYNVWGRPAKGINVGLYTLGLRWIGCVHDAAGAPDPGSCGKGTFFCTDGAGSVEFGTTGPGRLRAMVGRIYAYTKSGAGCANASRPTDLFNIGVQEQDAKYLCAQLGYASAAITAAPDSGHSDECPSIRYAPEVGMRKWTSAFAVGTGPFAETIRCSM